MADLSNISNDELLKIAGVSNKQEISPQKNINLSNEELFKIAGVNPTEKNLGLNTMAKKIIPTFFTGAEPLPGERTLLGNIFERPGAAVRSGIQSASRGDGFIEGYIKGANQPENVPLFQDQAIQAGIDIGGKSKSTLVNFAKGLPGSVAGFVADTVTNPADVLLQVLTGGAGKVAESSTKTVESSKNVMKAIGTSKVGKNTASQVKKAKDNINLAIDTITKNKGNLKFIDDLDKVKSGKLPENLDEFSQAIAQTKKDVFKSYSNLKQQAGEEMRVVFLDDIANELRKSVDNVGVEDFAPQAKNAAIEIADSLDKRGFYSVEQANDVIENLNQQLTAFYRNPDPKIVKENSLKALVANRLRSKLDTVINEETLSSSADSALKETFQSLKNRYGALKSIENDVNKSLIGQQRRKNKSLIDYTDIFTGQQLAEGVFKMNPTNIVKAATTYAGKQMIKRANNENVIISNVFKNYEKSLNPSLLQKTSKDVIKSGKKSLPVIPSSIESLQEDRKKFIPLN